MTRATPLEAYIANPEWPGAQHHAVLYDPTSGRVLMSAQDHGHDAALERLLAHKRMSEVAQRPYLVKSNRPPAVIGLLELIDMAEVSNDLDQNDEAVYIPVPIEDFLKRTRLAISAIEGGAS